MGSSLTPTTSRRGEMCRLHQANGDGLLIVSAQGEASVFFMRVHRRGRGAEARRDEGAVSHPSGCLSGGAEEVRSGADMCTGRAVAHRGISEQES
eukprot:scaffold7349_cov383-Pinguiococcus_pyrenoidosus.AAC.13